MGSADESSVKVLSVWRSMFGVRILMALKEKGVEYEYIEEADLRSKSQLLLESNPVHKKVPVLIHNGKPLCESLLILHYIDETWPPKSAHHKPLLPHDPYQRSLARFWSGYVDKMYDACLLIAKNYPGELMEQGKSAIRECITTLEGALRDSFGGGQPYFGGSHINLVDVALSSYLCWFETLEALGSFKVLDENTCPLLSAWAKAVVEHPSVKAGLATAPSKKMLESMYCIRKNVFGLVD
ncbi:hypothetical protein L7F22_031007 [Adiantum nelumboides]|nr:hypothetical protein [Adiantum nelumboides]